MASILKIARAASPPPSEARAKLAERIEELKEAQDRLRGIQTALDGEGGKVSFRALWDAETTVAQAKEKLAGTQKAAADYLLRDALGTAEGPTPDLEAARAAVTAAEDRVAAIRGAREALGKELAPAKDTVEMRGSYLNDAVRAVVMDETAHVILAAIEEIEALQRRLVAKHLALDVLLFESGTRTLGANVQPGLAEVAGRADYPLRSWRCAHVRGENDASPARSAWKAAIEALRTDPNAKLPASL